MAATFTFNFRFLASSRDYFQTMADGVSIPPVAHFWSLCVEEHFYWVWPGWSCCCRYKPAGFCRC